MASSQTLKNMIKNNAMGLKIHTSHRVEALGGSLTPVMSYHACHQEGGGKEGFSRPASSTSLVRPPWISSDKSPGSSPFGPHSISSLSSLWPQFPYLESKGPDLGFLGPSIQKDALGEAVGAELPSLSTRYLPQPCPCSLQ